MSIPNICWNSTSETFDGWKKPLLRKKGENVRNRDLKNNNDLQNDQLSKTLIFFLLHRLNFLWIDEIIRKKASSYQGRYKSISSKHQCFGQPKLMVYYILLHNIHIRYIQYVHLNIVCFIRSSFFQPKVHMLIKIMENWYHYQAFQKTLQSRSTSS